MDQELQDILYNARGRRDYDIIKDLVTNSKPMQLSDIMVPPESNMATRPQLYNHPDTKYRQFPAALNSSGMVFKQAPTTAFIGKSDSNLNTMAHEGAHTQQNMNPMSSGAWKKPTTDDEWSTYLNESSKDRAILEKVEDISKKYSDKNILPYNAASNIREAAASLQALEAEMPAGHLVWEHPEVMGRFTMEDQKRIEKYMLSAYDKIREGPGAVLEHAKSIDWMRIIQRNIRNWTAK